MDDCGPAWRVQNRRQGGHEALQQLHSRHSNRLSGANHIGHQQIDGLHQKECVQNDVSCKPIRDCYKPKHEAQRWANKRIHSPCQRIRDPFRNILHNACVMGQMAQFQQYSVCNKVLESSGAYGLKGGWGGGLVAVCLQREQPWQQLLRMPLYPLQTLHRPPNLHTPDFLRLAISVAPMLQGTGTGCGTLVTE